MNWLIYLISRILTGPCRLRCIPVSYRSAYQFTSLCFTNRPTDPCCRSPCISPLEGHLFLKSIGMGVHAHLVKIGPPIHFPVQYRLAYRSVSPFSMHQPIARASTSQMDRPTGVHPHPIPTGPPIYFPVQYGLAYGSSSPFSMDRPIWKVPVQYWLAYRSSWPFSMHWPIGSMSLSQMNRLMGIHTHLFLTGPCNVNRIGTLIASLCCTGLPTGRCHCSPCIGPLEGCLRFKWIGQWRYISVPFQLAHLFTSPCSTGWPTGCHRRSPCIGPLEGHPCLKWIGPWGYIPIPFQLAHLFTSPGSTGWPMGRHSCSPCIGPLEGRPRLKWIGPRWYIPIPSGPAHLFTSRCSTDWPTDRRHRSSFIRPLDGYLGLKWIGWQEYIPIPFWPAHGMLICVPVSYILAHPFPSPCITGWPAVQCHRSPCIRLLEGCQWIGQLMFIPVSFLSHAFLTTNWLYITI